VIFLIMLNGKDVADVRVCEKTEGKPVKSAVVAHFYISSTMIFYT
jgi:hypothetical protein